MITIKEITTTQERGTLNSLAAQVGHEVFNATHLVLSDKQLAGYLSVTIGDVAMVFAWVPTNRLDKRDLVQIQGHLDGLVQAQGKTTYTLMTPANVEYQDILYRLGAVEGQTVKLYKKDLE